MSDSIDLPHDTAHLAPVVHSRWRIPRRLSWLPLIAVLAAKFVVCQLPEPDCATSAHDQNDGLTVGVCHREYQRTHDPKAGALLADALRATGNIMEARALASGLTLTSASGHAFRVLGRIAEAEHRDVEARRLYVIARDIHRKDGDHAGAARDDQALAGVDQAAYRWDQALELLGDCITEATLAGDPVIEGYCDLSVGRAMIQAGSFASAERQFELANAAYDRDDRAHHDRDLAWLELERGNWEQESERSPLATHNYRIEIASFKRAIDHAEKAQISRAMISGKLNLAYSMAEDSEAPGLSAAARAGELERAEQMLHEAELADQRDAFQNDRKQGHANLAYHRGELASAVTLYAELFTEASDADDQLEIATRLARIALAQGDLPSAERWASHGIAAAETIRDAQHGLELRAWTLATRREPYELRFTALARARRYGEAVTALDRWRSQMLIDQLVQPMPATPFDLREGVARFKSLQAQLPSAQAAPLFQAADARLAEIRTTELLALVIANHDLWRVTSGGGAIAIDDLGPIASYLDDIQRFEAAPNARDRGEQLGKRLVPDSVFRATRDTLRVVLDGPLMGLPVAALRHGGQPLAALRPIVHAVRLSALGCIPRPAQPRPITAVADASGDQRDPINHLPRARAEAAELAATRGATLALGNQATTGAVFSAGPRSLLHVAVHADVDSKGGFLELADRRLYALEIPAHKPAPSLVVLSACGSAVSSDLALAGSLALAFLAAGSQQVVATLHTVTDDGAHDVMSRFYRAGGADDPVRALAQVQAALAADDSNADWPNYAVFGQDLCSTTP